MLSFVASWRRLKLVFADPDCEYYVMGTVLILTGLLSIALIIGHFRN